MWQHDRPLSTPIRNERKAKHAENKRQVMIEAVIFSFVRDEALGRDRAAATLCGRRTLSG